MTIFFEVLEKSAGLSRIGRIILSREYKKYISTPNIIIPLKKFLLGMVDFLEEFEYHQIFMISKVIFLKIAFLRDKFKNNGFIYTHHGTLNRFREILEENIDIFSEDNIIALIPFNIPSYAINRDFASTETNYYIKEISDILKTYPNLNFGITLKQFDYLDLFNEYLDLIRKFENVKILNFNDLFDSLMKYRGISELVINAKNNLDRNLVFMASGDIPSKLYPVLVYLGFDLINNFHQLYLSSRDLYDTIEYSIPVNKIKYLPCSCSSCSANLRFYLNNITSKEKVELLSLHNLITSNTYMRKIKQYLRTEDWRYFVEKSVCDETRALSLLKVLDMDYSTFISNETPVFQKNKLLKSIGPSSYFRPDFFYYRKRALKTFTVNNDTQSIILFPCSAKKPYSLSKSHKKFHSVVKNYENSLLIQEFILTSPLGVIPRELENIYPVNSYDISVTGDWDDREISIARNMLAKFLKKYQAEIPVICHLPKGGYNEIVSGVIPIVKHKFYFTDIEGSPTTAESLKSLSKVLKKISKSIEVPINLTDSPYKELKAVLDYHFGKGVGAKIIAEGIKLRHNKRRNLIQIKKTENGNNLGVWYQNSGNVRLTFDGANLVKDHFKKNYYIRFDGDKIKGSTLFRPGIVENSADLKPKDLVMIWDSKMEKIIGIGDMIVGAHFIKNSKSGMVASIINKF